VTEDATARSRSRSRPETTSTPRSHSPGDPRTARRRVPSRASRRAPRREAAPPRRPSGATAIDYAPDLSPAHLRPFALAPGQFPPHQLAALAWASYFVGWSVPGREALLASAEMRFGDPTTEPFHRARPGDPRRRSAGPRGPQGERRRGRPVRGDRVPAAGAPSRPTSRPFGLAVGPARPFAGRTVLVTGSSRGFGAALAARVRRGRGARGALGTGGEPRARSHGVRPGRDGAGAPRPPRRRRGARGLRPHGGGGRDGGRAGEQRDRPDPLGAFPPSAAAALPRVPRRRQSTRWPALAARSFPCSAPERWS
jgi:hypothetical protein